MATQAGLFSAVVTAFIIDSKQNLKASPEDKMEYYFQQNNALLDQISRQISFISPQLSIPSTPPAPFPDFKPSAFDIRVNVFWFMALILSLSAALLATLVQQWVRDYMHVFQWYSDPLKRARARQYLHEGSERWRMRVVAEAVPGLLQVSLFLYFVGLCDFVLNINTKVGVGTTIAIAFAGLLYVSTTVIPVIDMQWPYRSSLSGLLWYAIQNFKDRSPRGASRSVSSDMAEGQVQRAMAATKHRSGLESLDNRAIRWLVSNATEGAGMESFVMAIPGSFDEWGGEMWSNILFEDEDGSRNTSRNEPGPSRTRSIPMVTVRSHTASDSSANTAAQKKKDTLLELSARVGHLLNTCQNKGHFASDELWRRRTRACIETTALLVCCVRAELSQFGDMVKQLGDIGKDQAVRESSSVGKEQSFVMRWTCLSLVAIRPVLESNQLLHNDARLALKQLEWRDNTPTRVDKIMEALNKALGGLEPFFGLQIWGEDQTKKGIQKILRDHDAQISELEQIDVENAGFQMDDWSLLKVQRTIDRITHGVITSQLPGVKSDDSDMESVNFGQFVDFFRDPHTLLFIFPLRNLTRIHTFAKTLRKFLGGQTNVDTLQKMIKDLREFKSLSNLLDKPVLRQVWRLQDLSDGGGLGFTVELFFLAFKQLLSTSSSKEPHSGLYVGTFRAITSDWSKYKNSVGTQRLLLDMVAPHHGIIFSFDYPDNIIDAFLAFLRNILNGQTGDHINDVAVQLRSATHDTVEERRLNLLRRALSSIPA